MSNGVKKILYIITQSELGGAQRYCLDLAINLRKDFDISFAFGEQGNEGELAKKLKEKNIKYYTLPHLKRSISLFNDLIALKETIKLIKKIKPDIVHLNSSKVSIIGSIARIFVRSRIIYTAHGWVFNEPLPGWKKSFYFWAEKFTARFKDKIICISRSDYDVAKNLLNIKEEKLTLIYHGIEPINFLNKEEVLKKLYSQCQARPPASSLAGEVGRVLNAQFLIVTIANLYKTKGLEYLIEATKILENSGLDIATIVIGEGEERKNLENLIAQTKLKNKFILAGKIENAARLLTAFDIYVSSSVKEGLPYNILEAMSAGLPIVATRVGGVPEMIVNRKNGLLAEPQSPEDLANKIKTLIGDGYLRDSLSVGAIRDVKEKFGIERMIEKTKGIY